jgi:2-polyprenyl-6-methoxyphenol hydroxylase-like FAD-dependent oxidoreductase
VRRILIVGAGQAGLQLALGLLHAGYEITVAAAQHPDELRQGPVMSTQCMFGPALQQERDLGLNLWEDQAPRLRAQRVTLSAPPGNRALSFTGAWDEYAQSVDQRLKMAGWLELFEADGGSVIHQLMTVPELDALVERDRFDLTVVATGRSELATMFARDPARSPFTTPQRHLACTYVNGVELAPEEDDHIVSITAVPGIGECFLIPGLTLSGPCEILLWETLPDGPLGDRWTPRPDPDELLRRMLDAMRQFAPWDHERSEHAALTDAGAVLTGAFTPVVRQPVAHLPSGRAVLGMADAVVLNDPVTGQGSNSAAHNAAIYLRCMLDRGDEPFDEPWMVDAFDAFWSYARPVTEFTNAMLGELPPHIQRVLATAAANPAVALRFSHTYAHPELADWLLDPVRCEAYLADA